MPRYKIGNPASDSSGVSEPVSALWNPSSTRSIFVVAVDYIQSSAITGGTKVTVSRLTTQGTPANSVTVGAVNCFDGVTASPAGTVYGRGNYTVAPTKGADLYGMFMAQPVGGWVGIDFLKPGTRGIVVGPGTGIALFTVTASTGSSVTWTWDE